jgi:hypothetical protein
MHSTLTLSICCKYRARPLAPSHPLGFTVFLQTLAHEFIENAVTVGCMFAKHRSSNVLETKDLQLHM